MKDMVLEVDINEIDIEHVSERRELLRLFLSAVFNQVVEEVQREKLLIGSETVGLTLEERLPERISTFYIWVNAGDFLKNDNWFNKICFYKAHDKVNLIDWYNFICTFLPDFSVETANRFLEVISSGTCVVIDEKAKTLYTENNPLVDTDVLNLARGVFGLEPLKWDKR